MSMKETAKSVLINPLIARDIAERHRAATPLELFYDLIYVVAIASLASELHHAISAWHHVGYSLFMYLFIFFLIWWPWNSYTWFASGYDTDDAQFRMASLVQMVGVIIIAVGIEPAFLHDNFLVMMLGYVIMRIPFILMWLKVAYDDKSYRPVALRYAIGVLLVQLIWSLSILYYPNWYLFIGLVLLEIMVPIIAERAKDNGENTNYHFGHIEERMGLLTIIVLGESILAVMYAFEKLLTNMSNELISLATGAVLILFSMWWLYFDDKVENELADQKKAFVWAYGHYLVFAFAAAVGVFISVNVDVAIQTAKINPLMAIMGLATAISGYLLSVWLCHDHLMEKTGLTRYQLLILAVAVLLIAYFLQSIVLIGVAFALLNVIRLIQSHKASLN